MADLIGDDTSRAFFAHPRVPARVIALLKARLKDRHQKIIEQGDIATATVLARLAASDEVAAATYQLNRGDNRRRYPLPSNYMRPTVDALLWHDPQFRELLAADPQHSHKLRAFRCAARDERSWRACLFIEILSELAKMTTQFSDKRAVVELAERGRAAVIERQTADALRAHGFPDDAARRMQLANIHLDCARILARRYAREYRDKLVLVTYWRLARHFGFKANRIAAALVSAALELDVPISPGHTRHLAKSFYVAKNRRAIS